jgi:uncharacterized protein with ATP-grasp and redox domains
MNLLPICLPCLARNVIDLSNRATDDLELRKTIIKEGMLALANCDYNKTPAENLSKIVDVVARYTNNADLFKEDKLKSNAIAEKLIAELPNIKEYSSCSFESKLRLAVAGNIIDFGVFVNLDLSEAISLIRNSFTIPIDTLAVQRIKEKLESAKKVLYLADNCGEIIFDKVFIEPYKEKITIAVRGGNTLNDVTINDLESCKLNTFGCKVISNGVTGVAGTPLNKCSKEFIDAFNSADLIISKGQGNFESLHDTTRPIVFLFLSKCQVISDMLNSSLKTIQIKTANF